jgi:ribosomal-protein-serine acetyltransferase
MSLKLRTIRQLIVNDEILLKEIGLEDVKSIFETINNERYYLREWLPFVDLTKNKSYTRTFVKNYLKSDRLDLTLAIYYQNHFAGMIALKDTDPDNKKTEIGYWLSKSFQGKEIVTRSSKRLIDYAFDVMDMNRIKITVASENLKSRRIPERLNFTKEGIERDGELLTVGFVDLIVYSLLKSDISF